MAEYSLHLGTTLKRDVRRICISHPHAVTFGQHSTDIWEITLHTVEHRVTLVPFIEYQGRDCPGEQGDVIIDHVQEIVVIPSDNSEAHYINVYGLNDGQLIRKLEVYGKLKVCGVQYCNGCILVATTGDRDAEMNAQTTLNLYDINEGQLIRKFDIPLYLVKESLRATFVPVLLTANRDILATSSNYSNERMALFRWKGSRNDKFPSKATEIELDDGDYIRTSCSLLFNDTSFVISAYEYETGHPQVGEAAQSIIHRIDIVSLKERWYSRPIFGEVIRMQYVVSHNAIVAIGKLDEGNNPESNSGMTTTVTVIDASTGALEHADKVNDHGHGRHVQECSLSQTEDAVDVVILFSDGSISITSLDMFLLDGFERDGDSLKVHRVLGEDFQLSCGAVGERSAMLAGGDSEFSMKKLPSVYVDFSDILTTGAKTMANTSSNPMTDNYQYVGFKYY